MSAKKYYILLLLVAACSLWIRAGFPVFAMSNLRHDDQLYLLTARNIGSGRWLGSYNNLTLAKGMFYPAFIVAAFFLSVPLKIAEQVLYLAMSALIAELALTRAANRYLGLVLFGCLAFNPVLWSADLARVIREGVYVSLPLAVVALFVLVVFPSGDLGQHNRQRAFFGLSLGAVGAAFWLTREEGFWLVPSLAAVLLVALIGILRPNWVSHSERGMLPSRSVHLRSIAVPLALALLAFVATDCLIAGLNYRHYGVFETNEFRSASFLRAYGAVTRIKPDNWKQYILFPKDARQRAYAVSPAARELASSLEGPLGAGWRRIGCTNANIVPCPDVPAGWFMWELRDAVANAGHYRSAVEARTFYNRLADEIDQACARGDVECLPRRDTLTPAFRWQYVGKTVKSAKTVARILFTMGREEIGSLPSVGSPDGIAIFADIVGPVYPPGGFTRVVQGWAAAASATPAIHLLAHNPGPVQSSIAIMAAPDLVAAYPDLKYMRFDFETGCAVTDCDLVVQVAGMDPLLIPLTHLVPGPVIDTPALHLVVDNMVVSDSTRFARRRRSTLVKIATVIASGYAIASPTLATFGAVGLVLAILLRRRHVPTALLALELGMVAAVVTRIGLLAYIDATSFPAANLLYVSSASPFLIVFAVIGIYAGLSQLWIGGELEGNAPEAVVVHSERVGTRNKIIDRETGHAIRDTL